MERIAHVEKLRLKFPGDTVLIISGLYLLPFIKGKKFFFSGHQVAGSRLFYKF